MFKAFFACQDPYKPIPPKKTHPNWKVDPFIAHIMVVAMRVTNRQLVSTETMRIKGELITRRKEMDFKLIPFVKMVTLTVFTSTICHHQHNTSQKSVLHFFLFDQLKEKYHVCGLDNLYNSVKFCRDAWARKNKVMVHGVARKTGRGVPDCCQQEEFSDPAKAEAVRGTTKAAVLDGDPDCTPVVCVFHL